MMSFWCICYLLWVKVLHNRYPLPMIGALNAFAGVLTMVIALWFSFPQHWRKRPQFRKRLRYLNCALLYILLMSVEYWFLSWLFFTIPQDFQWTLALTLPFTREVGSSILTLLCVKASGSKDSTCELVSINLAITYHSLFLSVCIANTATDLTIWILLVIDFLINICFSVRIYFLKKKSCAKNIEKICNLVQVLVLSEFLEMLVPLGYLACFLVAYYGPNGHMLGNIKNSYWQYEAGRDIWKSCYNLILLLLIDSISFIVSFLMLYFVSNINLLKVLLHLQTEYGLLFAIHQAFLLEYLFCTIAIGCAFDFTFQFDWLEANHKNETNILECGNLSTTKKFDQLL